MRMINGKLVLCIALIFSLFITPVCAELDAEFGYSIFYYKDASGYFVYEVHFKDESSGNPVGWTWQFDDDSWSSSSVQNPVFEYDEKKSYAVQLVVKDSDGELDSETHTLNDWAWDDADPKPIVTPTPVPTLVPTAVPTAAPTPVPTAVPTPVPTPVPMAAKIPVLGTEILKVQTWHDDYLGLFFRIIGIEQSV